MESRSEGGGFGGTLVEVYRDGYAYEVGYESRKFYSPPEPGLHLAIHVFEDPRKRTLSCDSEEKAALAEFPHYGGKDVGKDLEVFPLPGKARGACVTGYPAKGASQEQVATYYEEKLARLPATVFVTSCATGPIPALRRSRCRCSEADRWGHRFQRNVPYRRDR